MTQPHMSELKRWKGHAFTKSEASLFSRKAHHAKAAKKTWGTRPSMAELSKGKPYTQAPSRAWSTQRAKLRPKLPNDSTLSYVY